MNQPRIFISSTCYDLGQIRADLFDFISSLGYHPVMSEFTSFPIDPDSDTIENCVNNVKTADIFILIVGNRYGHVLPSKKSITNTEYLFARSNGIPIYVFIYRPLITILPIWKQNPTANFSGTVDSIKVFEFVEDVRDKNKHWAFEFEKAQDIIQTLKIQFSHLYKQSLDLRRQFKGSELQSFHSVLSPKAINIALSKDLLFEPAFFAQVLEDELEKLTYLRLDLKYKILTNCIQEIKDTDDLIKWFNISFQTLRFLIDSLNSLISNAFVIYYGEPGKASDLKGLFYVSQSVARIYKELLLWCINVKSLKVEDDFLLLRDSLSDMPAPTLESIWEYPKITLKNISSAVQGYNDGEKQSVEAVLVLKIDDNLVEIVSQELDRLREERAR